MARGFIPVGSRSGPIFFGGLLHSPAGRCDVSLNPLATGGCAGYVQLSSIKARVSRSISLARVISPGVIRIQGPALVSRTTVKIP